MVWGRSLLHRVSCIVTIDIYISLILSLFLSFFPSFLVLPPPPSTLLALIVYELTLVGIFGLKKVVAQTILMIPVRRGRREGRKERG